MTLVKFTRKSLVPTVLTALVTLFTAANAFAATIERGYVTLENGDRVYRVQVKGTNPAPPVVIVNGIIYGLSKWETILAELAKNEINAMVYSLPGQPENLLGYDRNNVPEALRRDLTLEGLSDNLGQVLKATGLGNKKIVLVGVSYGTAPAAEFAATHPKQVADVVFGVPLVIPLDRYDEGGAKYHKALDMMRSWENLAEATVRFWNPWAPLALGKGLHPSEITQDFFGRLFLEIAIKVTPPGVDIELFKLGIFNLMRAADNFNLNDYRGRLQNVHEVIATEDLTDSSRDQYAFWKSLPASARKSLLVIEDNHMLAESSPHAVGEWLKRIATRDPMTRGGQAFHTKGEGLPVEFEYKPGAGAGASTMPAPKTPAMGMSEALRCEVAFLPSVKLVN